MAMTSCGVRAAPIFFRSASGPCADEDEEEAMVLLLARVNTGGARALPRPPPTPDLLSLAAVVLRACVLSGPLQTVPVGAAG